jgi:hypothetical protein
MEVKYTKLPVEENTATLHAIKSDLTPALSMRYIEDHL